MSQFEPSIHKYRPEWEAKDLETRKQRLRARDVRKDGHIAEAFRISVQFNQQ